ncbi:MAG: MiaB/RimO family radical SAM methylthiotransferase [Candidatus Hydrothermae bacterium]|nr:MiaB/RimO family radical SAM methylthiotransferase [Candidatus Hydrothermae bacterium]
MSEPRTFHILTLGCRVNQWDSQAIRQQYERQGYREVSLEDRPSLVILNTCAVTHKAARDARKWISRIRRTLPGTRVLVTGCLVPVERLQADEVVPKEVFFRTPTVLDHFGHRHRPVVKVQDGCDFRCTFCIVPHVRGASRSRPLEEILTEIRRLLDQGYQELVLAGVEIGSWGRENRMSLVTLAEAIARLPGTFRVRFSSLLPIHLSDRLLAWMRDRPDRFAPHLHLPLQSGSARVLRAMRRPYHLRTFLRMMERVRHHLPHAAVGTDVIAGFPGETDQDFLDTLTLLEQEGFAYLHVFEYSPRRGTPAADRTPVPAHVRRARVRALLELDARLRNRYLQTLRGRSTRILIEKAVDETWWTGTTDEFARGRIALGRNAPAGQLVEAYVAGVDETHHALILHDAARHPV